MTFQSQLATDLTGCFFNTDEFSEAVSYTPNGGAATTVNVILAEEDPTIQSPTPPGDTMIVLAKHADIAAPAKGDLFTIDGAAWNFVGIVGGGPGEGIWHIRVSRSARRDIGGMRRL
jgi:hypothetical protein